MDVGAIPYEAIKALYIFYIKDKKSATTATTNPEYRINLIEPATLTEPANRSGRAPVLYACRLKDYKHLIRQEYAPTLRQCMGQVSGTIPHTHTLNSVYLLRDKAETTLKKIVGQSPVFSISSTPPRKLSGRGNC